MEVSLDLNYFLQQINNNNEKEYLCQYYENYQNHLFYAKKIISIKKELNNSIQLFITNNTNTILDNDVNLYQELYNDINVSISVIENDANNYKNYFLKNLFYLIKK